LRPYDVVHTAPGTVVTEFFFTRELREGCWVTTIMKKQGMIADKELTRVFVRDDSRPSPCWTFVVVPRSRLVLSVRTTTFGCLSDALRYLEN